MKVIIAKKDLARDTVKQLSTIFSLDNKTIEVVKVISAKKDLSFIYSKTPNKEETFQSYIKSIIGNHSEETHEFTNNSLRIKIRYTKLPDEIDESTSNRLQIKIRYRMLFRRDGRIYEQQIANKKGNTAIYWNTAYYT